MYPLRSRLLLRGRPQTHPDVNSPDDEHVVLGQFDFTDRFAGQPVAVSPDVARLQRAPEGPRQSAGRRGDDVVECRGAGLECAGGDLVVLGDRAVDAEDDRLRLAGEVGAPDGPFHPFYPDVRPIHDVRQSRPPLLITKHSCSWLRLPQMRQYPAVTGYSDYRRPGDKVPARRPRRSRDAVAGIRRGAAAASRQTQSTREKDA